MTHRYRSRVDSWRPDALTRAIVVVVLFVEVVGTFGASSNSDRYGVSAVSLLLVVLGPLSLLVHRRWPIGVAAVTLGSSAVYLALGYAYGPVFLSVVLGLYWAVQSGRRTAAFTVAALGYGGYVVATTVDPMGDGLDAVHLALVAGWMTVVLALSELARVKRAEIARGRQQERDAERARAEAERVRIAQDLHDVLAHNISLINVQSSVALHLIDDDPEQAREALANIKAASRDALQELRAALDLLRDSEAPRAPSPTGADLGSLVDRVRVGGLQVELIADDLGDTPAAVQLAAYRIVQEALTNTTRHAHATRATVSVLRHVDGPNAGVEVVVADDGVGVHGQDPTDGRGLTGMRERATSLGGSFESGPSRLGGFEVRAHLPSASTVAQTADEVPR